MGLDSIWDENGDYLTKKSKNFHARSTGCSCCAVDLTTEEEVKKEAIESLSYIWLALRFFKWDMTKIMKDAIKLAKSREAKE